MYGGGGGGGRFVIAALSLMQTKKGGGGGGLNFEFLCFDRPKFSEFLLFSVRKICKKMKRFSPRLS